MQNLKYYEAYEERYKTAHEQGVSWECGQSSPIVMEIIRKYGKVYCALPSQRGSDFLLHGGGNYLFDARQIKWYNE
ncbi:MAG: hypothetical protein E7277_00375 [Lachnospiraceae bacterium]|nr:hypothetical protein [Lachnospiraceae bacterium]